MFSNVCSYVIIERIFADVKIDFKNFSIKLGYGICKTTKSDLIDTENAIKSPKLKRDD